jgi:hypothetical protein
MSEDYDTDYGKQVESFTPEKSTDGYTFIKSNKFRVVWTDFGDGEKNPELSLALSDLITDVNVSDHAVTFNVLQTVNREDLQLIEILRKSRVSRTSEVIIHAFDEKGDTLPYYLVASVYCLDSFSLAHSTEDQWDRPVTNMTIRVDTKVRNAATFIDEEMAKQAKYTRED